MAIAKLARLYAEAWICALPPSRIAPPLKWRNTAPAVAAVVRAVVRADLERASRGRSNPDQLLDYRAISRPGRR
jgi:hypothetical protein